MERRIQRPSLDRQHLTGAGANHLRDAMPVLRSPRERLQDEQVESPPAGFQYDSGNAWFRP
jgi:hypothetical protein